MIYIYIYINQLFFEEFYLYMISIYLFIHVNITTYAQLFFMIYIYIYVCYNAIVVFFSLLFKFTTKIT